MAIYDNTNLTDSSTVNNLTKDNIGELKTPELSAANMLETVFAQKPTMPKSPTLPLPIMSKEPREFEFFTEQNIIIEIDCGFNKHIAIMDLLKSIPETTSLDSVKITALTKGAIQLSTIEHVKNKSFGASQEEYKNKLLDFQNRLKIYNKEQADYRAAFSKFQTDSRNWRLAEKTRELKLKLSNMEKRLQKAVTPKKSKKTKTELPNDM